MKFVAWNNITDEPATEKQKQAIRNLHKALDWKLPRLSGLGKTKARDIISKAVSAMGNRIQITGMRRDWCDFDVDDFFWDEWWSDT